MMPVCCLCCYMGVSAGYPSGAVFSLVVVLHHHVKLNFEGLHHQNKLLHEETLPLLIEIKGGSSFVQENWASKKLFFQQHSSSASFWVALLTCAT